MKFFITLVLICLHVECVAQLNFGTLEKNINQYYHQTDSAYNSLSVFINALAQDPDAVDMVTKEVYQKKKPTDVEVNALLGHFDFGSGKWTDINYNDTGESAWEPKKHAERLLLLASLYTNPISKYYRQANLKLVIHLGLNFWFNANLRCRNWWFNEIGIPKTLGPVFIMLRNELSSEEIEKAVLVLNQSTLKMTGQNKVWLAGNVMFKAILLNNESLATIARDTILSELKITNQEGIQIDYSFHQHGPQQQFGNYGLSFVNSLSFWSRIFSGTSLQIDHKRLAILRNLLLQGYDWITWKGYLDINSFGRQFFKGVDKSKALAIAYSMLDMTFVDATHVRDYQSFIFRNYGPQHLPSLIGTKHFWRSDMTVHRSPNWFATLKMSSTRVQATEALNRENLKGYFLGDGNYFVNVDGDEYEDIFPYLNWKMLPGVTNIQSVKPLPVLGLKGYRNEGDFTGGVVNGTNAITAFKLNRDSLSGNKAWFWLNEKLICLGANIASGSKLPVSTTINQTNSKGPIIFFDNKVNELKSDEYQSKSLKWIYHNKIGYYNLQTANITINSKVQTGSWGDIAFVYDQQKAISKPVFTLYINHNNVSQQTGGYAYALVPGVSIAQLKAFIPDFRVVQNNKQAQIIASANNKTLMLAVYEPITFKSTTFANLKIETPGLYIFEKQAKGYMVAVADPTQKMEKMSLQIGSYHTSISLPQGLHSGETTRISIP